MTFIQKVFLSIKSFDHDESKSLPLLFSSSLAIALNYLIHFDFSLRDFSNRAIGIAILNGIDPSLRQNAYFITLGIAAFSFVFLKALMHALVNLLHQHYDEKTVKTFLKAGFEIGLIWFFTLIFDFSNLFGLSQNELVQIDVFNFIGLPMILSLEWYVLLLVQVIFHKQVNAFYQSDLELWLYMLLPIVGLYSFAIFRNDGLSLVFLSALRIGVSYGLVLFLLFMPKRFIDIRRMLNHSIFLFLIILVPIFSSELQFTLMKGDWSSEKIMKYVWMILVLSFVFSYAYYLFKGRVFNLERTIDRYILPSIIVIFYVVSAYQSTSSIGFLDLVGIGNKLTPVQQFLSFGSIPLVDYWGAQHFELGVLFYGLIHGMEGLNPLIWVDFKNILILLIFYFSFKPFWGKRWAFLFLLFMPALGFINIYYFGAFLPMLIFQKLMTHKGKWDYFFFTLLSLIAFVWMPSMGKISIIASFVIMLMSIKGKAQLKAFLIGAGLAYFITVFVYVALVSIKGYSLYDQYVLIKAFAAIDYDVGAYPTLIAGNTPAWKTILVYGIFPLFYVGYLLAFFYRKEKHNYDYFMVFMIVASFVSSLRVLGRHSLYEGSISFDFMLIILLTLSLRFKGLREEIKQGVFIGLSLFFVLFYGFESNTLVSNILEPKAIVNFTPNQERVLIDGSLYPSQLVKVLKDALKEDETFYDNMNANLIFALTDQKQAFLHHSAQMIYSQAPQEVYIKQFEEKLNLIPIVLFDGYWWGADTDGIPTEFSTFKLTEFIYLHYEPWINLDGYNLWIRKDSELKENFDITQYSYSTIWTKAQSFNLIDLPYLWANTSPELNIESLFKVTLDVPLNNHSQVFEREILYHQANYLYLRIESLEDLETEVILNYGEDNNEVKFMVKPGENVYAIRMSTQYDWFNAEFDKLWFYGSDGLILKEIQVLKAD